MTLSRCVASTLVATVAALTMGGCFYSFDGSSSSTSTRPSSSVTSSSASASTWTSQPSSYGGDLGSVRGFDNTGAVIHGTDVGGSSTVRIDAENTTARWWAMTQLSVVGSLSHATLVPGAHLVFNGSTRANTATGTTPLFVSALGCSGPQHGQYTFDHAATEVAIDVGEGPDATSRTFTFVATFISLGGETQHVTGSFVYSRE